MSDQVLDWELSDGGGQGLTWQIRLAAGLGLVGMETRGRGAPARRGGGGRPVGTGLARGGGGLRPEAVGPSVGLRDPSSPSRGSLITLSVPALLIEASFKSPPLAELSCYLAGRVSLWGTPLSPSLKD